MVVSVKFFRVYMITDSIRFPPFFISTFGVTTKSSMVIIVVK